MEKHKVQLLDAHALQAAVNELLHVFRSVALGCVKSEMEAAIQKLKDAHKTQDVAAIDTAIAELNAVAQKMYQAGAQAGPQAGPDMNGGFNGGAQNNNAGSNSSDAQDADFEEVK